MEKADTFRYQTDTVAMSNGEIIKNTPEAIAEYHAARTKAFQAKREQDLREADKHTGKQCPFVADEGAHNECKKDCAFYLGDACALTALKAEYDTLGHPCPFMRRCDRSCAAYREGCTLIKNA